jgi:GDP-L-fucose synthase
MIDLSKERILITGATGFFGQHIVAAFRAHGVQDLVTVGSKPLDLRVPKDARTLLQTSCPDIVVHCAAHCGGIGLNKEKPAELFYDNIMMGANLIDASHFNSVKKFIQLGTVCEYPKFASVPFKEIDLWEGYPEETNAPYGVAKKALLVMGQAYRQQYGFNVIHLLPVNLYGPGDHFDPKSSHVIPALIRTFVIAKDQGHPSVEVWGTGKAGREFLYVEDAAEAIVLATEYYNGADPVNIGTGNAITIRDLAVMIAAKIGYTGDLTFNASMPDGQPKRCLDTSRARLEFGFEAKTSFSEGLDKTIAWYLQNV